MCTHTDNAHIKFQKLHFLNTGDLNLCKSSKNLISKFLTNYNTSVIYGSGGDESKKGKTVIYLV